MEKEKKKTDTNRQHWTPTEFTSTTVLPYVKDLFDHFRRCLQQLGIYAVLKSETTLRLHLERFKDTDDPA